MTTIDRELLELAAKAAGVPVRWEPVHACFWIELGRGLEIRPWDPLADDGDALRLANRLQISIQRETLVEPPYHPTVNCGLYGAPGHPWAEEVEGDDPDAATRRAIVRAAAEIGRAMQKEAQS